MSKHCFSSNPSVVFAFIQIYPHPTGGINISERKDVYISRSSLYILMKSDYVYGGQCSSVDFRSAYYSHFVRSNTTLSAFPLLSAAYPVSKSLSDSSCETSGSSTTLRSATNFSVALHVLKILRPCTDRI